jgi:cytochrome P450
MAQTLNDHRNKMIHTASEEKVAQDVDDYLGDTSSSSDPYPLYARLREIEPVHWSQTHGYWIVTTHAEAEECFRDARLSRHEAGFRQFGWIATEDDPPEVKRAVDTWRSTILNFDPPDHTRLRKLISRAFTARAVSAWKSRTEAIVGGVLDRIRSEDEFDLLKLVAYPIPETVICELLGVPLEDHDRWKTWSSGMNSAAIFAGRNQSGDDLPAELRRPAQQALMNWYGYFSELIAARDSSSGDGLIALLVRAEEEGDRLTTDELIGTLTLLIGAGHDTTANLIANGMLALMRNPDQYALLREDPQQRATNMVEETLRFDGSARSQPRVALVDMEIGGRMISAGDTVMVIANAANRDPARFPDPDRFDLNRRDTGHLAFASGIHFCVGAALARMEAEVAFRKIAELDSVFELATQKLAYRPTHGRNLTALPVRKVR